MISFQEAQEILRREPASLRPGNRTTADAAGYVLAGDQRAREDSPRFSQAAMDGYAVRSADLQMAGPDRPVDLEVVETVAAGDSGQQALGESQAFRIFTGAPIPRGADAVVMQEVVERTDETARFTDSIHPGENIRDRGEELEAGEQLLPDGHLITPASDGLLISQGLTEVSIYRRPRVSVIATGNELVDPGERPKPGQIRDSNGPALAAAAAQTGVSVSTYRVADRREKMEKLLADVFSQSDLLLISGGVSVGEKDLVKPALSEIGVEELFWKVWQKPGKPIYLGRRGTSYVLGLPGNPVSSLVCFYLYGIPLIRKLSGYPEDRLSLHTARTKLEEPRKKRSGRAEFLRARTLLTDGEYSSTVLRGQGSHMLSGLARANSLVELPAEAESVPAGGDVRVYFLP